MSTTGESEADVTGRDSGKMHAESAADKSALPANPNAVEIAYR